MGIDVTEEMAGKSGRPSGVRAEARQQVILDAALELVKEVGYDRLSMDALAERAHAGKATIYRHWSGKAEVVVEAIRRRKCDNAIPVADTGSLRNDLVTTLGCMNASMSADDSAILVGLLSTMHKDQELADLMRSQVINGRRGALNEIVERAIARGELSPTADPGIVNEILPALLFNRLVITGEPVDSDFIDHMVDAVVLPLLRC